MFAALARDFRKAPITFVMIAASVVLFFAVEVERTRTHENDVRSKLGAIDRMVYIGGEDVFGPTMLWSGPWWRWLRIPMSAFHHANLLHLVCNVSSLWFFGPLMERRLRRVSYFSFWLFASTVPILAEVYMEKYAIGLSGVACALFGWCLCERHFDSSVAYRVNDGVVRYTWVFLIGCVVITALGIMSIANLAHFVGVAYGWLNARVSRARFGWLFWLAGHALLPVAIYGAVHPFWIGRYHAHLGLHALSTEKAWTNAIPHFQEAVRRDPALPSVWVRLASERATQFDLMAAWKLALTGLEYNRTSHELENLARAIWRLIPKQQQDEAMQILKKTFVGEADTWSKRLIAAAPTTKPKTESPLMDLFPTESDWDTFKSDESHEPLPNGRRPRKRKSPEINPDNDGSAVEGQTL